jgi:hypothetical protein
VVGHDGDAPARVLLPETFDLFNRGVKVVAGMNNEKQVPMFLKLARKQIVDA